MPGRADRRRATRPGPGARSRARAAARPAPLPLRRRRRAAQEPGGAARGLRALPRAAAASRSSWCWPVGARAAGAGVRLERGPSRDRLAELYAGAAALVHPSLHEGFGLTPLEAMRAGHAGDRRALAGRRRRCAATRRATSIPRDAAALAAAMVASSRHEPASSQAQLRASAVGERAARVLVGGLRTRARRGLLSSARRMKIAILGTRGHPRLLQRLRDGGRAARLAADRARPRGHRLLPPARRRPQADGATRAPSSSTCARSATSTSTRSSTRSCSAMHAARVTRPDVALFFIAGNCPLCLITRGRRSRRSSTSTGWTPTAASGRRFAKAYLRFAERTAPRWADRAITDSHAVADIFERRYGQRIGVVPYGVEDPGHDGTETLERLGLEPRQVHPVRRAARAREQPAPARRGVRADRRRAGPRDEARDRRRRALRGRLHPPGLARGRPARGLPRLRLRPRLLGAPAPRLRVLRADRGRRHPPGDPRGDGRRQLRARQRPRAERRDGRRRRHLLLGPDRGRRPDRSSSTGCSTSPSSSTSYRARALERAERYSWDAVTDEYEPLLTDVHRARGHGSLPEILIDRDPVPTG